MPPAIRVENLSKEYRIGERARGFRDSIADVLAGAAAGLWRRLRRRARDQADPDADNRPARGQGGETFWALRDVSFEVQPGEVVGIIGRNGAGKIDAAEDPEPDHRADRRAGSTSAAGVASLLEVGTGLPPRADRPREHLPQRQRSSA